VGTTRRILSGREQRTGLLQLQWNAASNEREIREKLHTEHVGWHNGMEAQSGPSSSSGGVRGVEFQVSGLPCA
jgi:hypothetical protein